MVGPDQPMAIIAALFGIAWLGFVIERTRWGRLITGAVWAILLAIVASNLRVIPRQAPAYGFVFTYLVPVIIPLFLFKANVVRILRETGRVGIAFAMACAGTTAGAIIGTLVLDLGPRSADLAGIFTATYTGGSVNYAAVIQSTGFDDRAVISAATAVDNLASALFLGAIAVAPAWKWLADRFAPYEDDGAASFEREDDVGLPTGESLAAALALSTGAVALSFSAARLLDIEGYRYVVLTAVVLVPATLFPRVMARLHGAEQLGLVLAFVFFAAIAAGADVQALLTNAPVLLAYVVILLTVHALVVFGGAALVVLALRTVKPGAERTWGPSLPELIIASNAAILGATTAPALAAARGWRGLVTPGVLVGVAGYVVGTPLGIAVAEWLGRSP